MKLHFSPLTKVRISFTLTIVMYTLAKCDFLSTSTSTDTNEKMFGLQQKTGVSQRKVAGKQKV